jgi:hypothetical protein
LTLRRSSSNNDSGGGEGAKKRTLPQQSLKTFFTTSDKWNKNVADDADITNKDSDDGVENKKELCAVLYSFCLHHQANALFVIVSQYTSLLLVITANLSASTCQPLCCS